MFILIGTICLIGPAIAWGCYLFTFCKYNNNKRRF